MTSEHTLTIIDGASSVRSSCACGKKFPRVTGLNRAGYCYAMCGLAESYIQHLVAVGAISTEEATVPWADEPVLRVRAAGRIVGYAGEARGNHWVFVRRGKHYSARYASRAHAAMLLLQGRHERR